VDLLSTSSGSAGSWPNLGLCGYLTVLAPEVHPLRLLQVEPPSRGPEPASPRGGSSSVADDPPPKEVAHVGRLRTAYPNGEVDIHGAELQAAVHGSSEA
jgi:hypothetical protein